MVIRLFDRLLFLYLLFYFSLFVTDYSFFFAKSGLSNITGFTIGLILFLFLRYALDKKSFLGSPLMMRFKNIFRLGDRRLLTVSVLAVFVAFAILSIARHISFSSGASDLGIFDQAVWNTAQGRMLMSSLKGNMSLLGDHFEPILIAIAPLYKIWPSPIVLLIAQALLLASAIIPLYLIAREKLRARLLVFAFILSYILSQPLRGVALSDFHPECFIVPLLFWGYYFLIKGRNLALFLTVVLLLSSKEDAAFLVCGLGIFSLFFQKRFKVGVVLIAIGILAWVLETQFIIPHFNPLGKYPYLDRLPFGLTYDQNLKAVFREPTLLARLLFTPKKILYCLKLFSPLGFLPLASPPHLILVAIPLVKNLLPANPHFSSFYNISSHYTAGVIPFLYIAAIYGAARITGKTINPKRALRLGVFLIFCSLLFYGKSDAHRFAKFLKGMKNNRSLQKLAYLRIIPADASVAANFNLVPHLSCRRYVFEWNPQNRVSRMTQYLAVDFDLLEYLSSDDIAKIEPYFKEMKDKGYKDIFRSPDGRFLILHNIDTGLAEKI